ncbi:DUF4192 domain-containing protein [uncultured Corynebacterium sp.]|uniref:DUF4192 domain-containing protein n=1 Tax=uncultured Corynebacterium sp. TaxID=159447 RepID=UPI0025E3FE81|nr:DUF4192 domain-containing protein [uncultured Corynebacterium sp.]
MTRRGHVPSPPDRDPATGMNLDDPVDCLTNLPGLLGHYPVESLILVAGDDLFAEPGPILVRRLDGDGDGGEGEAPSTDADATVDAVHAAVRELVDEGHERVDVYVVSETWCSPAGDDGGNRRGMAAEIAAAITDGGLRIGRHAGVREVRKRAAVVDAAGRLLGHLGDPTNCWASDRLHASGEVIAPDRAAVLDRFRPDEGADAGAVAEAVRKAHEDVRTLRRSAGMPSGSALREVRLHHVAWLMLVEAVDGGDVPFDEALSDPGHVRTLARPLISLLLRDMTMSAVLDDTEPTVRALWLGCARIFRGTVRANALACYAIDRQVHGSASVAGAAVDAALETDPSHSLSQLLAATFASGRAGTALRAMLEATGAVIDEVHAEGSR